MGEVIEFKKPETSDEAPPPGVELPKYGDWGFLQCPCCHSDSCAFALS